MKVLWLNDSLVLRAESPKEREALAVVGYALEPSLDDDLEQNAEGAKCSSEC
jgi:hypothetical protein